MNIFIHRRDIRCQDNTTLLAMKNVLPLFIYTPEQIDPQKNPYFSDNLVEYLSESLLELQKNYQSLGGDLLICYGDIIATLEKIHKISQIKTLGFNVDYSPYSKKRDQAIEDWAKKHQIKIINKEDHLLVNILEGATKSPNSDQPYKVYTPFYNNVKNIKVMQPVLDKPSLLKSSSIPDKIKSLCIKEDKVRSFFKANPHANVKGGRSNALLKLKLLKDQTHYASKRDQLTYQTSHLSGALNLGVLSIREVYHHAVSVLGKTNTYIKELYWRDFYYNVLYYFPHVVGGPFKPEFSKIKWRNDKKEFTKWCEGQTGYPVVDAAMRQLNTTGFMHNRARMIVASFLTKHLLIDWRWGEKYFATKLIDYNISANNGGWQWSFGSGTDAQPYFRIFNPWSQGEKYDSDCEYVKKWIPELNSVPNKDIHAWYIKYIDHPTIKYPQPIVDHAKARELFMEHAKVLKRS
uniref:Photolyase/cryptochrome alpha/beta domain-containing protein n=1 Tax=viral metagenome TaxID=1070528 RepID=A0A6C0E8M1_9ZZZZ